MTGWEAKDCLFLAGSPEQTQGQFSPSSCRGSCITTQPRGEAAPAFALPCFPGSEMGWIHSRVLAKEGIPQAW